MHTVSGLFHSPSGVLFTFPSRYFCTIGHPFVFSLGGWSPQIRTGFHVSRPTQDTARRIEGSYRPVTCCGGAFHPASVPRLRAKRRPTTPDRSGLGSSHFARHYSGNHVCFLFLWLLRCFSSPGWLPLAYVFSQGISRSPWKGFPIRSPGSQWICAPRTGFSQLVASFFADGCLGIPRVHSIA